MKLKGVARKKSLGQHWLKDPDVLNTIADSADLTENDTVLEIGPGLGTLTSALLRRAGRVIAVEYDEDLARKLPKQFPGKNLAVIQGDFLNFDLEIMPKGYKVVANLPYYITQKIVEKLLLASNQPMSMTLLVQREVAEKLTARTGKLTAVAVKLQLTYDVRLHTRVPKEQFIPPPKVDSQVVLCTKHHVSKYEYLDIKRLFKIIDAGFSAPRKKIRTALAGGLGIPKATVEKICQAASVAADLRAEAVEVEQWLDILRAYDKA